MMILREGILLIPMAADSFDESCRTETSCPKLSPGAKSYHPSGLLTSLPRTGTFDYVQYHRFIVNELGWVNPIAFRKKGRGIQTGRIVPFHGTGCTRYNNRRRQHLIIIIS